MRRRKPLPASSSLKIVAVIPNAPKKPADDLSLMPHCSQRQGFDTEELEREGEAIGLGEKARKNIPSFGDTGNPVPIPIANVEPKPTAKDSTNREGQRRDRQKALERLRCLERKSNDQDHKDLSKEKLKTAVLIGPEAPVALRNKKEEPEYFHGTRSVKHRKRSKAKIEVVTLETAVEGVRVFLRSKRSSDPPPPPLINAWSAKLGSELFAQPGSGVGDDSDLQEAIKASLATQNAVVEIPREFYARPESNMSYTEKSAQWAPPPRNNRPHNTMDSVSDEQVRQKSRNPEPPVGFSARFTDGIPPRRTELIANVESIKLNANDVQTLTDKTEFKTDEHLSIDSLADSKESETPSDVELNRRLRFQTVGGMPLPDYFTDKDVSVRSRFRQRGPTQKSQVWDQVHNQPTGEKRNVATNSYVDSKKTEVVKKTHEGDYFEKPKKFGSFHKLPPKDPNICAELAKRRAARFNNSAETRDLLAVEKKQYEHLRRKVNPATAAQGVEGQLAQGDGKMLQDAKSNQRVDENSTTSKKEDKSSNAGYQQVNREKKDEPVVKVAELKSKELKAKEKMYADVTHLKESVLRHLSNEKKPNLKKNEPCGFVDEAGLKPQKTSTPICSPEVEQPRKSTAADKLASSTFIFKPGTPPQTREPDSDVILLTEQMFTVVLLEPGDFEFKPPPGLNVPMVVEEKGVSCQSGDSKLNLQKGCIADPDKHDPDDDCRRLKELSAAFKELQQARVADQNLISTLLTRDQSKTVPPLPPSSDGSTSPLRGGTSPVDRPFDVDRPPYTDEHDLRGQHFHVNQNLDQYINAPPVPPRNVNMPAGDRLAREYATQYLARLPQSQYLPLDHPTTQLHLQQLRNSHVLNPHSPYAMNNPVDIANYPSYLLRGQYQSPQMAPAYLPYMSAAQSHMQFLPNGGQLQYVANLQGQQDVDPVSQQLNYAAQNQARNAQLLRQCGPDGPTQSSGQLVPNGQRQWCVPDNSRDNPEQVSPQDYLMKTQTQNNSSHITPSGSTSRSQSLSNNLGCNVEQVSQQDYVQQSQGQYVPNNGNGQLQYVPNKEGENVEQFLPLDYTPRNQAQSQPLYMTNSGKGQPQYVVNEHGQVINVLSPRDYEPQNQGQNQQLCMPSNQGQKIDEVCDLVEQNLTRNQSYVSDGGKSQSQYAPIKYRQKDELLSPRDYVSANQAQNQPLYVPKNGNNQPEYVPNDQRRNVDQPSPRDYVPSNQDQPRDYIFANQAQNQPSYVPKNGNNQSEYVPNDQRQNVDQPSPRDYVPSNQDQPRDYISANQAQNQPSYHSNNQPEYVPNNQRQNNDIPSLRDYVPPNQGSTRQSYVPNNQYPNVDKQPPNLGQTQQSYVPNNQYPNVDKQLPNLGQTPQSYVPNNQYPNFDQPPSPEFVSQNQAQHQQSCGSAIGDRQQPNYIPNNPPHNSEVLSPRVFTEFVPRKRTGSPPSDSANVSSQYGPGSRTAQSYYVPLNYNNHQHSLPYPNRSEVQTDGQFVDPQCFRKPHYFENKGCNNVPDPGHMPVLPKPPPGWIRNPELLDDRSTVPSQAVPGFLSHPPGILRPFSNSPVMYSAVPDMVGPAERYKMNYNTPVAPHPPFGAGSQLEDVNRNLRNPACDLRIQSTQQ